MYPSAGGASVTFGEMMWAGFFVMVFALWQVLQSTSIRRLCDRIDALEKRTDFLEKLRPAGVIPTPENTPGWRDFA